MPATLAIAKVWVVVTLPVTSRVPPEAVIVLVPVVKLMPSVPEPVTFVLDDSRPVPVIVPPDKVTPEASVNWTVPAASSLSVPLPTANWVPTVNVLLVFSSSVPLELKVTV
jgi:hypothetical protein